MKENIIVVGGYGHVGATICKELGEVFPGKVYAAGRKRDRAEAFCRETDGKVLPLQMDISKPVEASLLGRARLVVMCLDQTDTAFAKECLRSGTNYMDVSANGSFLSDLEQWGRRGEVSGTGVFSIGLAPGLTNLLASEAQRLLVETVQIDISIMLGLGDRHGRAAIEWTVDNLCSDFEVTQEYRRVKVASFTDGKLIDFGTELGRKKAYRFPFSDQQTLARTLGVPTVSTRMGFDQDWMTRVFAGMRTLGIRRLLNRPRIRQATIEAFERWKLGDDRFAIKVEARGNVDNTEAKVECLLSGRDQSKMTAMVAAEVAKSLYTTEFLPGVFHIEQLFRLEQMRNWLEKQASLTIVVR
ncbi:saccharopine dehydrogenase family protein [uncultured Brevibacillus sp.]|uniref:saccharopine dehydrogenase family protein n=1 Tax=uncultured Brevibacillus sp. TaxID=169970 RepID=UPI002594E1FF|nr:saccharopine dehydrogenase NADP-binding domain-containing protein [uncultured Brevibacillus sp.]